ncbi:hypothetical protein QQ045_008140 [Rhodiola kirilowii]
MTQFIEGGESFGLRTIIKNGVNSAAVQRPEMLAGVIDAADDTVRGSDGIGAEEEERADCVRDNIGEYADEGEAEAEGAV